MLSGIFSFLRPAPDAEIITDEKEVQRNYRYWRTRVLYAMILGYAFFYFVRKSLAVAMPVIEKEFDIPKSSMGLVLTLFGLTYGVSKFVNGFLGDRSNPRYFMAFGLACSAIINFLFGLSSGIVAFSIFWILNGWFQGMGWAPCSKTLVHWFSKKERGFKFAISNTAVSVGSAGIMFLNGFLVKYYGWRACFLVPASIALLGALFIVNRLRDRPQSLGLPPVEQYTGEEHDLGDIEQQVEKDVYKRIVGTYIFRNPMMWIVCVANLFVYVIRYTVLDWGTMFLSEAKGLDITRAAWIVGGYEVAGMIGMLVGGLAMDKLFKGYGGRTCAIYMGLCAVCIFLFWKLPLQSVLVNGVLLWAVGFLVYGPQCLVAPIAANMVPKQAGAAAVGLTGLFGYLSTVISGVGLGAIVQGFGWNGGFFVLVLSAVIGMLMFVVLWNVNSHLMKVKTCPKLDNRE